MGAKKNVHTGYLVYNYCSSDYLDQNKSFLLLLFCRLLSKKQTKGVTVSQRFIEKQMFKQNCFRF